MTEEELRAIEARCEAATPGPWDYDEMHQEITTPYSSDQYWLIVSEARQTPDQDYPVDQFGHTYDANFAFIAHARADIPALLAEVERLRVENAAFQEAINDYHADAVEWRDKYNTERERNSRLERSNASNLKACDELKAKLEQTTALLIAECDETVRLRAELTTAKAKLDAECVAATIETLAAQREAVNGRGWLARAENELDACFMDAAPLDQAYAWCDNWAYALIEEVKQLSRERADMGELCGDARIGRMVRDLLKWGGGHMPISSLEAMTHD